MTFKDKSKRPAGKPSDRGAKPLSRKPAAKTEINPARAARSDSPAGDDGMKPERISKLLARVGVASRRDIERMIMEGRVKLNGTVLDTPVVNVTLSDKIEVDDQPIRGIERTRLWLYHKPAGLVTTNSDPEGRSTVFDNLPEELPRVMSIGRLDINTEGLLLLTNDGGLARVLELPTTGWLRRYRVRAFGEVDQPALDKLKEGMAVDGVLYGAIDATLDRKQGHNVWITMGLREGKNREIKNVLGALGLEVNRLIRISYGPFQLGDLPEGDVQEVRGRMLRDQLGPRLIEDAKANFDAPIFAHGGVVEDEDDEVAAKAKPAKAEWAREERREERPAKPRFSEKPGDKRERALDRLDTRRDDSRTKPAGKRDGEKRGFGARDEGSRFGDKPKRAPMAPKSRTANVWMAPGARPVAEKKAAVEGEEAKAPRARREGAPESKRYGRGKDGKPTKGSTRFNPDSKGRNDFADRDTGPRVVVSRARDEEGDWIRADGPDTKPGARDGGRGGARDGGRDGDKRGGFGDRGPRRETTDRGPRRDFGDRPDRGDRPARADRPRGDSARSDAPRGERFGSDRPRGDRPSNDRPTGDRPRSDRPRDDRPRDDRPRGDKPFGAKPFGDKPRGAKPFGDKPAGKSFGGKPSGKPAGKSFGGKPGGRPPSTRADGGPRSFSGKPSGAGRGGPPKGKR
ncbi:pseudouridine synthase [Rhizobium sp. 18065]|uniref:pseudouridine synthase n=1 Tax=Rhizobium sp. 18065 TaxID=2681411 RepID=UPI00135A03FF|nr:pseudouridine synthase [Rhizobium sp. 18065]